MKPDDILNAIGDVEEQLVKRAHRRDVFKACGAFLLTTLLLILLSGFLMEPDYVLARFLPDAQPNTGFVEPVHLERADWTTMVYTGFRDGQETETTIFARWILGNYTILHRNAEGLETKLVGSGGKQEYLGSRQEKNLYTQTIYGEDLIGRVNSIILRGKQAYPYGSSLINAWKIEYYGQGSPASIAKWDDSGTLGMRVFSYENQRLSGTKDYDSKDQLVGYTEYVNTDSGYEAFSYDAAGALVGRVLCRNDWFGRIKNREFYDSEGRLTGREVYHYRFWERYRGIVGFIALVISLSLSATIGISIYDDRIPLPRQAVRKSPSEIPELEMVSCAIEDLEPVLAEMDRQTQKKVIARLYEQLRRLESRMEERG